MIVQHLSSAGMQYLYPPVFSFDLEHLFTVIAFKTFHANLVVDMNSKQFYISSYFGLRQICCWLITRPERQPRHVQQILDEEKVF